jgi:hypothetical protein
VALGGALISAGKAAMEDKRAADNLANTLGNLKGVTQEQIDATGDWIDSMELATLVSDTDLRAAVGKLALATGNLSDAQNLAKLATDVAAGSGKNYATVTDAMAKAATGNTKQLIRQFPWLVLNKDGTLDLESATKQLGKTYSGAAAKAAANDPWKRLSVIWGMLTEALGEGLLPLLKTMGEWFAKPSNRQRILDIVKALGDFARTAGEKAAKAIEKFLEWLESPEGKRAMREFKSNLMAIIAVLKMMAHWIGVVLEWCYRFARWISANPKAGKVVTGTTRLPSIPQTASFAAATGPTATTSGTVNAAQFGGAPQNVIVTEEQIYRAVARLLMRGEARNGRAVVWG